MVRTTTDAVAASERCLVLAARCMADAKDAITMNERIALVADAQTALSEALLHLRPHAAQNVRDPLAAVTVTTDVLHQVAWSEADPEKQRLAARKPPPLPATVHPIRPVPDPEDPPG